MADQGFGDPLEHADAQQIEQPAYDYEADRALKQQYLVDNIVTPGYDAQSFAAYMSEQRGKFEFC